MFHTVFAIKKNASKSEGAYDSVY